MPHFAMRKFRMEDGGGMPLHTNQVEHEQYVLTGKAEIRIGDETYKVEPGNVLYIPAGVAHSYAVTEGTPHPDLALSFVEYATSAEVSTRAIRERSGFFDPFRVEHYSDPVIGEIYGSSFLKVHRASLSNAIPDFYVANRNAYFDTLSAWLTLAIEGEVDPRTALSKAADHWRLLTSEQQKPRQAARWRQLRSSYPFAVSQKLRDTSDQPSAEEHADD